MNDSTDLRPDLSNCSYPRATLDESGAGPGILTDGSAPATRRPPWNRQSGRRRDLRMLFIVCSFGLALTLLIALNMN
jgi:hypothetical protein